MRSSKRAWFWVAEAHCVVWRDIRMKWMTTRRVVVAPMVASIWAKLPHMPSIVNISGMALVIEDLEYDPLEVLVDRLDLGIQGRRVDGLVVDRIFQHGPLHQLEHDVAVEVGVHLLAALLVHGVHVLGETVRGEEPQEFSAKVGYVAQVGDDGPHDARQDEALYAGRDRKGGHRADGDCFVLFIEPGQERVDMSP
jgi:hypothetical protein